VRKTWAGWSKGKSNAPLITMAMAAHLSKSQAVLFENALKPWRDEPKHVRKSVVDHVVAALKRATHGNTAMIRSLVCDGLEV